MSHQERDITLVIGTKTIKEIMTGEIYTLPAFRNEHITAQLTLFGWTFMGETNKCLPRDDSYTYKLLSEYGTAQKRMRLDNLIEQRMHDHNTLLKNLTNGNREKEKLNFDT